MITARKATSIVKSYIKVIGMKAVSVKSETVLFSDLARDKAVFVEVKTHGDVVEMNVALEHLEMEYKIFINVVKV